jgi:hypothetical protein
MLGSRVERCLLASGPAFTDFIFHDPGATQEGYKTAALLV